MSNLRKIIAWIFAFAIIIYELFVPAFASVNPDPTDSRGNFYDWVVNQGGSFGGGRPDDSIGGGRYSKDHYDDFVSELPAPGYSSAGELRWRLNVKSFENFENAKISSSKSGTSWSVFFSPISSGSAAKVKGIFDKFVAPIAGVYRLGVYHTRRYPNSDYFQRPFPGSSSSYYISGAANRLADHGDVTLVASGKYCLFPNSLSFTAGDVLLSSGSYFLPCVFPGKDYEIFSGYWEIVCQPVELDTSTYSVTTRPTSITGGNYGIVGDNGEITTVTNNNQIINETNNTYYNPATGQTSTISDWSYNYEDRSYTLTLESGDTTTVTYGDENISIIENNVVEGDTIVNNYTIYYMIDGSGSDNPSPAPSICPHSWQESSRTEPACTSPGKVVYVCSQCGQTKSETLKALGHDWQVERTVKTLYDENGNVTQQGYTIYQCSICGEQYKDADSTGPPDNTVNDGDLIEWLNGLIKHLSDNLSGAVDLILSFFEEIPKLFGGFLDFLSAMFPYLPDDIIFLLTFGIAALVFVGVIKAIRR